MAWYVLVGIVSSVLGIASVIIGGLKYAHRCVVNAVVEGVAAELGDIQAEVRTNGGKSMKDTLDALSRRVGEIGAGTDTRFNNIDAHLGMQDRRIDRLYELLGGKR